MSRRIGTPSLAIVSRTPHALTRAIAAGVSAAAATGAAAPIVCFPNACGRRLDQVLLLRLGDRVAEARSARHTVRRILAARIGAALGERRERFVMTSLPERYANRAEHTFISFARVLASDLGIEFVNDRFVESAPRAAVRVDRAARLRAVWRYRGTLHGRTALLVDQVIDSGTSLGVARDVLQAAGASVMPLALLRLADADLETQRVVHRYFGADCAALLAVPEIQGTLRTAIEGWLTGRDRPPGD